MGRNSPHPLFHRSTAGHRFWIPPSQPLKRALRKPSETELTAPGPPWSPGETERSSFGEWKPSESSVLTVRGLLWWGMQWELQYHKRCRNSPKPGESSREKGKVLPEQIGPQSGKLSKAKQWPTLPVLLQSRPQCWGYKHNL